MRKNLFAMSTDEWIQVVRYGAKIVCVLMGLFLIIFISQFFLDLLFLSALPIFRFFLCPLLLCCRLVHCLEALSEQDGTGS
jgi:hypothetical protein